MSEITLEGLRKTFGATEVIKGFDLTIKDRERIVFVGPSGCGKSTLLRMICGIDDISGGRILIDGKDVTAVPAAGRGLAMVFQNYALYPHMTVRQNIGFSLRVAGRDKAAINTKVSKVAEALRLSNFLDRYPKELSGGQRQRVAIGRAIVREPKAFLFDEPLSNLDAALRVEMRLEIARLHQTLQATMIYVTHDQTEAMTLADRIVVLNSGQIEQIGAPEELYAQPANRFVAEFIGSPKMNMFSATQTNTNLAVAGMSGQGLHLRSKAVVAQIGIRPEHIRPVSTGGHCRGRVVDVEFFGVESISYVDCGGGSAVAVRETGRTQLKPGDNCELAFDESHALAFGPDGVTVPTQRLADH